MTDIEIPTESARAVIRASRNRSSDTMLDASCKEVLAIKGVLAWILKTCVTEFEDVDVKDIETKYIEGEPLVAAVGVDTDETGSDIKRYYGVSAITEGELLSGSDTEVLSVEEGRNTFDIFFRALAPKHENGEELLIRLYIDIEPQNDTTPGYPLPKRALYNVFRIIAAQKGVEFTDDEYGKIKKAYSIWICPKPPKYKQGAISRYFIQRECLAGSFDEPQEDYDIAEVRVLFLPNAEGREGNGILKMLDKLLTTQNTVEEKLAALKDDFGIPITKYVERKVHKMCDYSAIVRQEGEEKGMEKGMEKGIDNVLTLMQKLFMAGRAADAERASKDRNFCMELLKEFGLA